MTLDINAWMAALTGKLEALFGDRLLFLGLQGSRGRGEARQDSDIDVVCVLDSLTLDDLAAYRRALSGMPDGELACGFVCGLPELTVWPDYDLLALMLDVKPVKGSLRELIPLPGRRAAREAVLYGAASLYHGICHQYLYGAGGLEDLRELYKGAFFLLRMAWYLETGAWPPTGRALSMALEAGGQTEALEILTTHLNWDSPTPGGLEQRCGRLLAFAAALLTHYGKASKIDLTQGKKEDHAVSI